MVSIVVLFILLEYGTQLIYYECICFVARLTIMFL